MSKLVDDFKSGLKGIHGAGDAIRGETLEATDQVFEKDPSHPTAQAAQVKNHSLAEKGKADIRGADEMMARMEKGVEGASVKHDEGSYFGSAATQPHEPGTVHGYQEPGSAPEPPRDAGIGERRPTRPELRTGDTAVPGDEIFVAPVRRPRESRAGVDGNLPPAHLTRSIGETEH